VHVYRLLRAMDQLREVGSEQLRSALNRCRAALGIPLAVLLLLVFSLSLWVLSSFRSSSFFCSSSPRVSSCRARRAFRLPLLLVVFLSSPPLLVASPPPLLSPVVAKLFQASVSVPTQRRRVLCLNRFLSWLRAESPTLSEEDFWKLTPSDVSVLLSNFGASLLTRRAPISWYTDLLCAVQRRRPECRKNLPLAWEIASLMQRATPVVSHKPLSPQLCRAFIAFCFAVDACAGALLIWVCFEGLLRPSEACNLTVGDIVIGGHAFDCPGAVTLVIRKHKSSFRCRSMPHHVRVVSHELSCALSTFVYGRCSSSSLFGFNTTSFRTLFRRVSQALGVVSLGVSPAGLRPGGAISLFQRGANISEIAWRGRWSSTAILRHYLRLAEAALPLTLPTREKVARFALCLRPLLLEFLRSRANAQK
jgi:hypothetical protein